MLIIQYISSQKEVVMLKNIPVFSAFAAIILLSSATGCATLNNKKSDNKPSMGPEALQENDRIRMQEQAMQQGTAMLMAMQNKDYAGFTQFFPEEVKKKFTIQAFNQFDTYIGKLEKWEYLTDLVTPVTTTYLWKTTVRRKNSQGQEITMNMLFQLALAKKEGKYIVVGSWFR